MREYASRWNGCAEKAIPIKKNHKSENNGEKRIYRMDGGGGVNTLYL